MLSLGLQEGARHLVANDRSTSTRDGVAAGALEHRTRPESPGWHCQGTEMDSRASLEGWAPGLYLQTPFLK